MAITLVPCLVQLRTEFNRIAPGRDKGSDGWIGDPAHQATKSDHNPDSRGLVHAIDVDRDLRAGLDMQDVVDHLVARCRSGAEKRLTYVIYNGRIWSASRGWTARAYTGSNPHDKHAHFSAGDTPAREASTASWHLEDLVALTEADKDFIRALFERTAQPDGGGVTSKIGRDALDQGIPDGTTGKKSAAWVVLENLGKHSKAILAAVTVLATKDHVDEQALAAELAPAVAALILPALPDGVDVTTEQLQQAIVGALRDLAADSQP